MWRRQRRLWWTSGETPLTTPHWPSTVRLWRESAALNSWGAHHRGSHLDHQHHVTLQEGTTAPTLSPPAEKSKSPTTHPQHILQGHHRECADQLHHCLVTGTAVLLTARPLQRTVNTAAKIIGAPLPSILDIFLARCSSKTNSIVKDPTHPSHSLFQLLPSGRRYRSIRARSARLLNSFFPPGCESPELKWPRPPLKPHAIPYLLKHGPSPPLQTSPNLTTPKNKM